MCLMSLFGRLWITKQHTPPPLTSIQIIPDLEYDPTADLGGDHPAMNATNSFPPLAAKSVGNIAEDGQKEVLGSAALQCLFHLLPLEKSFISNARTAEHFSKLLLQNLEVFSGSSEHAAEHITILMEDDGNTSQNVSETMAMSIALHAYQVAMRQTLELATSLLAQLKVDTSVVISVALSHSIAHSLFLCVCVSIVPRAILNSTT